MEDLVPLEDSNGDPVDVYDALGVIEIDADGVREL